MKICYPAPLKSELLATELFQLVTTWSKAILHIKIMISYTLLGINRFSMVFIWSKSKLANHHILSMDNKQFKLEKHLSLKHTKTICIAT